MDPRFTTLFFLRHQRHQRGIAGTLQAVFLPCAEALLPRQGREFQILRWLFCYWPLEGRAVFRMAIQKTAMTQKKLAVFQSHEAVEPIFAAGGIVTKAGGVQFRPLSIRGTNPLIAEPGFSQQMTVVAAKVFTEAIQSLESSAFLVGVPC